MAVRSYGFHPPLSADWGQIFDPDGVEYRAALAPGRTPFGPGLPHSTLKNFLDSVNFVYIGDISQSRGIM
jgi:hypothetical protein